VENRFSQLLNPFEQHEPLALWLLPFTRQAKILLKRRRSLGTSQVQRLNLANSLQSNKEWIRKFLGALNTHWQWGTGLSNWVQSHSPIFITRFWWHEGQK
jgi:hypothetical protein